MVQITRTNMLFTIIQHYITDISIHKTNGRKNYAAYEVQTQKMLKTTVKQCYIP